MFKKIISLAAFALSLSLLLSSAAQAGCGCQMGKKMQEMVTKLELTDDQKDKIADIMMKGKDAIKAKRDEMRDLRTLINGAFHDGTMTEPKIDEFSNKQMQVMGAMIKIRMMQRFEISKVLTPEQKEKLNDMYAKWVEDHKKKMQCTSSDKPTTEVEAQ